MSLQKLICRECAHFDSGAESRDALPASLMEEPARISCLFHLGRLRSRLREASGPEEAVRIIVEEESRP